MRLIALVGALLVMAAAPAQAAWHQYINQQAGFGVDVPADPTMSKSTYKTGIAGTVDSTIYTTDERGVTFSIIVVDFSNRLLETASLLQEAIYINTLNQDIVSDDLARAEPGQRAVYGRRISVNQKDGSRTTRVLFLTKGKLYIFEAKVPKGGDFGSPSSGRFIDSVVFNIEPGAGAPAAPGAPQQ